MTIPVPSLSSRGWSTELSDRADLLLSYYFTSDYLQSVLFHGQITSLQYTLEQHQDAPRSLQTALEVELKDYLDRYFEATEVVVEVSAKDDKEPNKLQITYLVKVQQAGQIYSLGRAVLATDNTIQDIFTVNNG